MTPSRSRPACRLLLIALAVSVTASSDTRSWQSELMPQPAAQPGQ
ncbi:hypothetical protein [Comamonas sp. A7-5]